MARAQPLTRGRGRSVAFESVGIPGSDHSVAMNVAFRPYRFGANPARGPCEVQDRGVKDGYWGFSAIAASEPGSPSLRGSVIMRCGGPNSWPQPPMTSADSASADEPLTIATKAGEAFAFDPKHSHLAHRVVLWSQRTALAMPTGSAAHRPVPARQFDPAYTSALGA